MTSQNGRETITKQLVENSMPVSKFVALFDCASIIYAATILIWIFIDQNAVLRRIDALIAAMRAPLPDENTI